ncbi:MAG: hypothetical protein ACK44O_16175 [Novosphingobium sp.]
MEPGRLALLSVGAVAIALGLAVLTRRTPGDPALYRRRIAGTMLLAVGLAAKLLTRLQNRAHSLALSP